MPAPPSNASCRLLPLPHLTPEQQGLRCQPRLRALRGGRCTHIPTFAVQKPGFRASGWRLASHPACTHRRQASSETAHGLKWTPQRGGRGSSDITFPPEHISDGCSLFTSGKDGFLKDVSQRLEAFLFLYLFLSKN